MLVRDHNASLGDSRESSDRRYVAGVRFGRSGSWSVSCRVGASRNRKHAFGVCASTADGVHCEADTACVAAPCRKPAVNPRPTLRLESSESRRLSPRMPDAGNVTHSFARLQVVTLDRPSPELDFPGRTPLSLGLKPSTTGEHEHARHYFRGSDNCFLSDFHRVCEVLRSHSLR